MLNSIIWSPESEEDFSDILTYLISEWNLKIAENFIKDINYSVGNISRNPHLYSIAFEPEKIRSCVISKHNTLFYTLIKDKITILRIFDTRQNPNKLKF